MGEGLHGALGHVDGDSARDRRCGRAAAGEPDLVVGPAQSALVTSAVDVGAGVLFQQGGGRGRRPSSLDQTVHSDLATADLGVLEYPHDDGETSTLDLTLTNAGDTDVSLDLATWAVNETGEAAPAEMITVEPTVLDVATGEAAP